MMKRACPHGCPLSDPDILSLQDLKRQWAALDVELRASTDELAALLGRILIVSSQRMRLVANAGRIIDKLEEPPEPRR